MHLKRVCLVTVLGSLSTGAALAQKWPGQESWSDSKPVAMEMAREDCPLTVRGLSGRWAPYDGKIEAGRQVIGAVNPRQPNVVFFQLKLDSPFMFAGPRTCFKGEEYWAEDPVEAALSTPEEFWYATSAFQYFQEKPEMRLTETPKTIHSLKARALGGCVGMGWEKKVGTTALGAQGCLGFAKGSADGPEYEVTGIKIWYGAFSLLGYYDFPSMPYALGLEASLGMANTPWPHQLVDWQITPQNSLNWTLLAGWRFYMDEWTLAPKIGFYKWPSNIFAEVALSYRFEFAKSKRSKFLEPK